MVRVSPRSLIPNQSILRTWSAGSGGVGPDEVGLLGQAVGTQAREQDRVEDGLAARHGKLALGRYGADDVVELARVPFTSRAETW